MHGTNVKIDVYCALCVCVCSFP